MTFDPSQSLDSELFEACDAMFQLLSESPHNRDTPDQLRMRIAATNLNAVCNVLLVADESPQVGINLKRVVLGLLGTADWLTRTLPELGDADV